MLSPLPTASSTLLGFSSARFKDLPPGSTLEISPAAFKIARKVGELVYDAAGEGSGSAGSALVVDYGAEKAFGNSFRVSGAYLHACTAAEPRGCVRHSKTIRSWTSSTNLANAT